MKYIPLLVLAALSIACSDSSGPLNDAAEGTWTVSRVNGKVLPDTFAFNADSTTFLARDTLHLRADGTYRRVTHLSIAKGLAAQYARVVEATGTFKSAKGATFLGSTEIVTFTPGDGGAVGTGYRTGDVLEMNVGAVVRYQR